MVEFIEQEMQDNQTIDAMQVMDETEKLLKKGKALAPLRPIIPGIGGQMPQWPMVNLRAREAERAA